MNAWTALRRPLLVAFVLGCAVSLMTSGRLTLRLVAPATLYWTFIPLCEIGSLAVVARGRKMPFARLIDTYFESHTAWLLWVVGFAAVWVFVPPGTAYHWFDDNRLRYGSAALVFAWSAWLDFRFFRRILDRTPGRAARDLTIQRLLAWAVGFAIFVTPAGWQVVSSALGL